MTDTYHCKICNKTIKMSSKNSHLKSKRHIAFQRKNGEQREHIKLSSKGKEIKPIKKEKIEPIDIKKFLKDNDLKKPINFEGSIFIELCMYLVILKRHKNDGIVIDLDHQFRELKKRDDNRFMVAGIELLKNNKIRLPATFDYIKEAIEKSYKKKDFVLIPFSYPRHANMLIYNPHTNTIEHYEPHGKWNENIPRKKCRKTYTRLKTLSKYLGADYMPPYETSQFERGLQAIEQEAEGRYELIDYLFVKDPGGYCLAWSYFIADIRLSNPDKSPQEVYELSIKKAGGQADKMRKYIRDFSKIFIKEYREKELLIRRFKSYPENMNKEFRKKWTDDFKTLINHFKQKLKEVGHVY